MSPALMPIPAPTPKADSGRRALGLGLSVAAGVLVTIAVCAVLWRRPTGAVAVESHAAQQSSAEASSASSVTPSAVAASPPEVTTAPALSAAAPPTSSANTTTFRGTREVTRATWRFGSVVYHAIIHTNGTTGYADVHAVQPGVGPVVIREDLRLQQGPKGWSYVGSNPRYADDGSQVDYHPNVFSLEHGTGGAWTFVETCAIGTGMCTRMVQENGR